MKNAKRDTDLKMNATLDQFGLNSQVVQECFQEAEDGLRCGEVPVGCVFLWQKDDGTGEILAKAHNRTNQFKCALKHAEMICVHDIVRRYKDSYMDILKQTMVLITLEPCIMCCRMLRMLNVKGVLYGARNDRFGGAGSVCDVHSNPKINSPPLNCIPALDGQKAIGLLQKFYDQTNENVPTSRTNK